jgi:hypothetical protein
MISTARNEHREADHACGLACEGKQYLVHEAIICPGSPILAAAVKKDFLVGSSSRKSDVMATDMTARREGAGELTSR